MERLILKKCYHCNAMVKIIDDCNCSCGIACCGEEMKEVLANSTDAAFEKHVPTYEIKDNKVYVVVNHVMEEDHYIEWISAVSKNEEQTIYLKPGMEAKATFKYDHGMTIYSYCNKHSLWKVEIE